MYANQTDAAKGAAIKGVPELHLRTTGQKLAASVDYAPLPKALLKQAKAQVKQDRRPRDVISSGSRTGRVPRTRPVPPLDPSLA